MVKPVVCKTDFRAKIELNGKEAELARDALYAYRRISHQTNKNGQAEDCAKLMAKIRDAFGENKGFIH